jgi:hypothetical protein
VQLVGTCGDGALSAGVLYVGLPQGRTAGLNHLLVIGMIYDVGADNSFVQRLGLPRGAPSD